MLRYIHQAQFSTTKFEGNINTSEGKQYDKVHKLQVLSTEEIEVTNYAITERYIKQDDHRLHIYITQY